MKKKDDLVQLKQKLIHFQSEANKYQQTIKQLEQDLIFVRASGSSTKKQTTHGDEKNDIQKKAFDCFAYFQYTTFLADQDDEDEQHLLVVGNLNIINSGADTLTNPVICIRKKPIKAISLGGKIKQNSNTSNKHELFTTNEEWVHIYDNWQEKTIIDGEYWLRSLHCEQLKPEEKLSFTNFDLRINLAIDERPFQVEAFIYFKQLTKGIPALNQITFH